MEYLMGWDTWNMENPCAYSIQANLKHYPVLPNASRKDVPDLATTDGHHLGFQDPHYVQPPLSPPPAPVSSWVGSELWALLQMSLGKTDKAHQVHCHSGL